MYLTLWETKLPIEMKEIELIKKNEMLVLTEDFEVILL